MKKAMSCTWLIAVATLLLNIGCASSRNAIKPVQLAASIPEENKARSLTLFKEGAELLDAEPELAAAKFSEAIKADPSLIAAYFNRGVAEEFSGDLKSAQFSYEACLQHRKTESACLENLLILKIKLSDHEGAKSLAESYLAEFPEEAFAYVAAAKWAFLENDLGGAEKYAREAIEREAENVEALYVMARIFFNKKQYAAAKWVAKNALEIAPSHGALNLLLGHVYAKLELLHDALDSYRLAVKYQPTEEALESYGLMLLKRGLVKEALVELLRVAKMRPLEFRHHLHVGNAFMAVKDFEKAHSAYLKAKELMPDEKDINFNLGLLYLDLKPEKMPELERLKTAQGYFKTYLEIPNLSKERVSEVNDYLASLAQKIELEEYAIQSAAEQANEPEPEPEVEPEAGPKDVAPSEKIEELDKPKEAPPVAAPVPDKKIPKGKPEKEDILDEEDEDFF